MLPTAHLGIGHWLAGPWKKHLPLPALLIGTLLPDLIDKPLYYALAWSSGRYGASLGLFSGTRSLGHSLLFFFLLLLSAGLRRSRALAALCLGMATHLFLDNMFEPFTEFTIHSSRIALFFPFYGGRFPVAQHQGLAQHLSSHLNAGELLAELVGIILTARLLYSLRHTLSASSPLRP